MQKIIAISTCILQKIYIFLQKINILSNKPSKTIQKFRCTLTNLNTADEVTRIDGSSHKALYPALKPVFCGDTASAGGGAGSSSHKALYPALIPVFCGDTASAGGGAGSSSHKALYPALIPVFCGGAASAGRGAGSASHAALHIASPPPFSKKNNQLKTDKKTFCTYTESFISLSVCRALSKIK
jgi:hypothetical protein